MAVPDLSIVTTTFNRRGTLPRLADSIRAQLGPLTVEWVIVDDGSTDDTEEWVGEQASIRRPNIVYTRQHNSGRYVAQNAALDLVNGRYIVIVDSDDWLLPGAMDHFCAAIRWLDSHQEIAGVVALCEDGDGHILGDRFPRDDQVATFQDVADRWGVRGDKKEVMRTAVMKEVFPFPVFEGERRFAMSLMWRRIGRLHRCRFINQTWVGKEFRADGLTRNLAKVKQRSARASCFYYREILECDREAPLTVRSRAAINYCRFAKHAARMGHRVPLDIGWYAMFAVPVGEALARLDWLRAARG